MSSILHKICVGFVILFLFVSVYSANSSLSESGEIIQTKQIIQDANGIGVVYENDISSYIDSNHILFIFLAFNQKYVLNGLYIAGFDGYGMVSVRYKLGSPYDTGTIWFDSSNGIAMNYGSIIYFDILDYIVAFGEPDEIKSLSIISEYSFSDMELHVNEVISEFDSYFVSIKPTTILTSTNPTSTNPTSVSSSATQPVTNPGSSTTSVTELTNTTKIESSDTTKIIPSASGFEFAMILSLVLFIFLTRRKK